jgi:hypothetical protein
MNRQAPNAHFLLSAVLLLYANLAAGPLLEVRPRVESPELLEVTIRGLNPGLDERPRGDGNENCERASSVTEGTERAGQD